MIDWILIVIALATGGGNQDGANIVRTTEAGQTRLEAEDQTPSGKFTTATEVKPILNATRANWVAIREYDGQDLLYVTHLLSWRCGLAELRYAVNDGEMQPWPLPPCLLETATPNAIKAEDGLPFAAFDLGRIRSVSVEITYDDLTIDSMTFQRTDVLMP